MALYPSFNVLAGPGFELRIAIGNLIGATVGVLLLAIDFGALAMLIGAATGSRGTALGITSAIAAASYIISSLAPVVHWIHPFRFASPFFYAVGDGQLVRGRRRLGGRAHRHRSRARHRVDRSLRTPRRPLIPPHDRLPSRQGAGR